MRHMRHMKINLAKLLEKKKTGIPSLETTDASYLAKINDGTAKESPYRFELEKGKTD